MTITVYKCDIRKNTACSKTHCGWLNNGSAVCFNTSKKEFAKLDEHGEAIVEEIFDTEELLPHCMVEEIAERMKEQQSEWAKDYARNTKGLGVIHADDMKPKGEGGGKE